MLERIVPFVRLIPNGHTDDGFMGIGLDKVFHGGGAAGLGGLDTEAALKGLEHGRFSTAVSSTNKGHMVPVRIGISFEI